MPRTMMLYGDTGSTKTSQCYFIARYLIKKYGKKGRLVTCSPGGYEPFEESGMIKRGEIELDNFSTCKNAFADVNRLSEGYWRTEKGWVRDFKDIGFYIVEDTSSISDMWLRHIEKSSHIVGTGNEASTGIGFKHSYTYEEDGYQVGGLQMGHFGIVQRELYGAIVHGFNKLPVEMVVTTGLVAIGEDSVTKVPLYGPDAAGSKLTYKIPSWYMDCFHLAEETYPVIEKGVEVNKTGPVAWLRTHEDSLGTPFKAKPRIIPEMMPELLKKWPNNFIPLTYTKGVEQYLEWVDSFKEEKKGIKGVA